MLRPYEAFGRLGLACLVIALVCAPMALGAGAEDPKAGPETLWEEFPLNPTGERLRTSQQQEPQQSVFRPPAATQAAKETPTPASGGNAVLLALVAGAGLLVALVVVGLSVRAWRTTHQPERRTLPLLQYAAWSDTSRTVMLSPRPQFVLSPADVDAAQRGHRAEHQPAATTADRLRRFYRRRSLHGFRPRGRSARDVWTPVRVSKRIRRAFWNENTIPVYVCSATAIVLALLIVTWAG